MACSICRRFRKPKIFPDQPFAYPTESQTPDVDSLLKQFAQSSQLGANAAYIEDLYEQYLVSPDSVGPKWKAWFDGCQGREAGDIPHSPVVAAVAEAGWKIVLLVRLSPVFPFGLLNYAFGVTRVKFTHYLLASWIGMMPGTVLYVYLGTLARAATASDQSRTVWEWAALLLGLLATLAVVLYVGRIAKRAMSQRLAPPASS